MPARSLQPAAEIARRIIVGKLSLEPVYRACADHRVARLAEALDPGGQLCPGLLGRRRRMERADLNADRRRWFCALLSRFDHLRETRKLRGGECGRAKRRALTLYFGRYEGAQGGEACLRFR